MIEDSSKELQDIKKRYQKREGLPKNLYDPTTPWMYMIEQERDRVLLQLLKRKKMLPLVDKVVLEIGCGNGNNILQFLKWGVPPENLYANELIESRIKILRRKLPSQVKIYDGNALELNFPTSTFDLIFQSMVFSSILGEDFRITLARKLWSFVKKGGGILWYDFIYNNPNNQDIKKVSVREIKSLFPDAKITIRRITLAPPIARKVTQIHPFLYTWLNFIRIFRSHVLCFIEK